MSLYCYPGTDILINHANIRDPERLKRFEAYYTGLRNLELILSNPLKETLNFPHLMAIHKHIFQDVYPFAGEVRSENISKDGFRFAPFNFIHSSADELFSQLKAENFLSGLPAPAFAERAAYYMAEINVLHPFREGNGRTQREFIRTVAKHAGYTLSWARVPKQEILEASIRSKVDTAALARVITCSIEPPAQLRLKDILQNVDDIAGRIRISADRLNQIVSEYEISHQETGKRIQLKFEGCDLSYQIDCSRRMPLLEQMQDKERAADRPASKSKPKRQDRER